jgi:hypothetical protein
MSNFYTTSDRYRQQEADARAADAAVFRYDIAAFGDPRIILITDLVGKRSELPRLGYVVLPQGGR